jgi:hypothetical protein
MGVIEEFIRIQGADEVRAALDRVGQGQDQFARKTEEAGEKAGQAGSAFSGFGYSAAGLGKQLNTLAASMFGLDALFNLASKLLEKLERIAEIRRELAGASTASLETVMPLAVQRGDVSQEGFEAALRDATRLRKEGLMASLEAAQALGTAADIKLPGGFDPKKDAEAFERNLKIAATVGAAVPTGTAATYSTMFEVLKAAGLTDPEQIKTELAKVLAVQKGSASQDPGAFLLGLASTGMKGFLAGGGKLTDAATILAQAREAVSNDAEAVTAADVILRAGRGSTTTRPFLAGKAKEFGLGKFEELTDTQLFQLLQQTFMQAEAGGPAAMSKLLQQGFEPGQFPILKAAFGQTARDVADAARKAAETTTGAVVEKQIQDFAGSQIGKERVQAADIEYGRAALGIDVFSIIKLRELAQERYKQRIARKDVRGGEIFEASTVSEEALVEREAMGLLRERILELQKQGADVGAAWKVYSAAERGNLILPSTGVPDELLDLVNTAVNAAIERAAGEKGGVPGGRPAPIQVSVTNVGTNYALTKPGYFTEPPPDLSGHGD